mmetsp:Transcript_14960/g.52506  ORF Transcript_14960/g.52506 Transcript_14960/m.52506 type:complete len:237 (-) Transcript_14960:1728-2438(-)
MRWIHETSPSDERRRCQHGKGCQCRHHCRHNRRRRQKEAEFVSGSAGIGAHGAVHQSMWHLNISRDGQRRCDPTQRPQMRRSLHPAKFCHWCTCDCTLQSQATQDLPFLRASAQQGHSSFQVADPYFVGLGLASDVVAPRPRLREIALLCIVEAFFYFNIAVQVALEAAAARSEGLPLEVHIRDGEGHGVGIGADMVCDPHVEERAIVCLVDKSQHRRLHILQVRGQVLADKCGRS